MPEAARELLMWHAVEEIEHKAVAFDVFQAVSGDRDVLRKAGVLVTAFFLFQQVRRTNMTLKALNHTPTLKDWTGTAKFLFGKKGVFRQIMKPYLEFYREDFHPWDHDNRDLVDAWKAAHGEAPAH